MDKFLQLTDKMAAALDRFMTAKAKPVTANFTTFEEDHANQLAARRAMVEDPRTNWWFRPFNWR